MGSITVDTTTATITGLTDGASYTFTVAATNAAGTGPAASTTGTPLAPAVPGAPTNLVATASPNELSVSFTPPSDNGSAITGYTATVSPADVGPTTSNGSPMVITGLSPGTSYTISLTATNGVGTGAAGTTTGIPEDANTAPGVPQDLVITAGDGELTATFTSPVSNGGEAITSYAMSVSPATSGPVSGSYSPLTVSGLTDGTTYTVSVAATNSVATGTAATATGTPMASAPIADPTATLSPTNGSYNMIGSTSGTATKTVESDGAHFAGTLAGVSNNAALTLTEAIPAGWTQVTAKLKVITGTYATAGIAFTGSDEGASNTFSAAFVTSYNGLNCVIETGLGNGPNTDQQASGPSITSDCWIRVMSSGAVSTSTDGVTFTDSGKSVYVNSSYTRMGIYLQDGDNGPFEILVADFEIVVPTDPLAGFTPSDGALALYYSQSVTGTATKVVTSEGAVFTLAADASTSGDDNSLAIVKAIPAGWNQFDVAFSNLGSSLVVGIASTDSTGGFNSPVYSWLYSYSSNTTQGIQWGELGVFVSRFIANAAATDQTNVWLRVTNSGACFISYDGATYTQLGTGMTFSGGCLGVFFDHPGAAAATTTAATVVSAIFS